MQLAFQSSIPDTLIKNVFPGKNFINFVKDCFVKWKQELGLTLVKTVLFMTAKQNRKWPKVCKNLRAHGYIFWMHGHFTCIAMTPACCTAASETLSGFDRNEDVKKQSKSNTRH